MTITILTLFPKVFDGIFSQSIIKRTIDKKILKIELLNIRDFGIGKHKRVDDKPYGGGEGMIMMAQPILKCLETIKPKPYTILLSASGKKFTQKMANVFSNKKNIALICGHYEGIDARVEKFADEIVSVGDFITTGGEIPAMFIVDSLTRLLPGSINPLSTVNESYQKGLLEYPQYTRPKSYQGISVPQVLLSGNHKEIETWKKAESIKRTKKFRPEMIKRESKS